MRSFFSITSVIRASGISAVASLAAKSFSWGITERVVKPTTVIDPLSGKRVFSLKELAQGIPEDASQYDAVDNWTISANHHFGPSSCNDMDKFKHIFPTFNQNYLVWTSSALQMYVDANIKHDIQADAAGITVSSNPATTFATPDVYNFNYNSPGLVEIKTQKPISPVSMSPDFEKVRKCSASGHALRPRSLGAAFNAVPRYPTCPTPRRGKPRKPQAFNNNRTMYL